MTEEELDILQTLAEAHNMFAELDHYNHNDMREWVGHVHALQNMVMAREAVRNNTDFFVQP